MNSTVERFTWELKRKIALTPFASGTDTRVKRCLIKLINAFLSEVALNFQVPEIAS